MTHAILADTRVLIVDDDAGARALHCRFLADMSGFALAGAVGTGIAAVEHIVRGGVDLVLLDMRLPDISGVEVLNRVRTLGPASPDVLVISASQDRVTVRQALAGQVVGYLVKPFTAGALTTRLEAYRSEHAVKRQGLEREVPLAQGEIDRLLSTSRLQVSGPGRTVAAVPTPSQLPKGISAVTLNEILQALDPVSPITTAALASASSVPPATARRYLDYLAEIGAIDLSHRYGKRGRPEVLYRLVPPPGA